jgi:hypothetical protein
VYGADRFSEKTYPTGEQLNEDFVNTVGMFMYEVHAVCAYKKKKKPTLSHMSENYPSSSSNTYPGDIVIVWVRSRGCDVHAQKYNTATDDPFDPCFNNIPVYYIVVCVSERKRERAFAVYGRIITWCRNLSVLFFIILLHKLRISCPCTSYNVIQYDITRFKFLLVHRVTHCQQIGSRINNNTICSVTYL